MNTAHQAATLALQAGLSTIPPRMDGSKAPLKQWKQYQTETPSQAEIDGWYSNGQTGTGLITGAVSGNLECLDFDSRDVWADYKPAAQDAGLWDLLKRVAFGYSEQTPNGFHLLYKCESIGSNTKLAQRADKKTLIETRAEGGFIIVAPSSGKVNSAGDYVLKAGGFDSIATITPAEREQLHTLARTFDEMPKPSHHAHTQQGSGNRPGDEFNQSHTWPELLSGWVQVFERNGVTHWRRPGKDEGISATTNHAGSDLLWVFSTSTEFESERSYDRFGAHVLLNHAGDFKAATRALGGGYHASHGGAEYADYTMGKQADEPQPLFKALAPALPFPMEALGTVGADAAKAMQRIIRAPDAICGQSTLAGLAQLAQGHADLLIDGRQRPVSCFFACVGETGERKSAVDDVATWPHRKYERELEHAHKLELADYEREFTAWKLSKDEGVKKAKGMQDKKRHLEEMGEAPIPPPLPVVLIEEPTYEGLIKVLQHGQPSVGLFTDEGGRFVGGHAMNSENALKTAAGISGLWDRGEAKRTRAGDGHSSIYGKRLSMHLMLQGVVAEILMSNDIFREQGWLSRVLMTWPGSTVGDRAYVSENVFEDSAVKRYHAQCLDLLAQPLPMNEELELNPPALELSTLAKRLWVPFHDYCDTEAAAGGELEVVRGLANKAPEHVARLAGVLSVMRGASIISHEETEAGITLMNYYLNEAIRIADTGQLNSDVKDAATLLAWLQEKKHVLVYPVLIYQKAPIRKLREKKTAVAAIELLEEHGWLKREAPTEVDGKHRKEVWRLNHV